MLSVRSGWYLAPCPALRWAHVLFEALGSGSSQLAFSDVLFLDFASNDIAVGAGLIAVGVMRSKRNGAVSASAPTPA